MEWDKDLYDILGISNREAERDEINQAFYKKTEELKENGATEEIKREVYDAHALLFNPVKREAYDKGWEQGFRKGYSTAFQDKQEDSQIEKEIIAVDIYDIDN